MYRLRNAENHSFQSKLVDVNFIVLYSTSRWQLFIKHLISNLVWFTDVSKSSIIDRSRTREYLARLLIRAKHD